MAASRPSCAIADIVFYTKYSDPSAPVIRLGTISEVHTKRRFILLMVGRSKLTEEELKPLSGFNRAQLDNVWKTLQKSFNSAWRRRQTIRSNNPAPGAMIAYLADVHSMALHFEPPQRHPLPSAVTALAERGANVFSKGVTRHLLQRLDWAEEPRTAKPKMPRRTRPHRPPRVSRTPRTPALTLVRPAHHQQIQIAAA